jgi:hypothetical protein
MLRSRKILAFISVLSLLHFCVAFEFWAAEQVRCSICKALIKPGSKYLTNDKGQIFCSKACFEKTLPLCSVCGRRISGAYIKGKDGKLFCSEACVSTTWPQCVLCKKRAPIGISIFSEKGQVFFCEICSAKPRCFCCGLPADCSNLDDGRTICGECLKTAVFRKDEILCLAEAVRLDMKEKLSLSTNHHIEYVVVDAKTLNAISPQEQRGVELGLFQYTEKTETTTTTKSDTWGKVKTTESTTVEKQYKIYLLAGISKKKLSEVIAHELAHDWMQEYYSGINDLKIKEGWAEYAASRMNIILKNEIMNLRMEKNPDPIYGDGFRMIKKYTEKTKDPMESLRRFFSESSREK